MHFIVDLYDLLMFTGTMLVSGSYDQTVVLWDAENCGPKLTLKVVIVTQV